MINTNLRLWCQSDGAGMVTGRVWIEVICDVCHTNVCSGHRIRFRS